MFTIFCSNKLLKRQYLTETFKNNLKGRPRSQKDAERKVNLLRSEENSYFKIDNIVR